jgi:hypothetical protein
MATDPLTYGSVARPAVFDPWHTIIEVGWGGAPIVVAEVPTRLAEIYSLDPLDLTHVLTSSKAYMDNEEIPKEDYGAKDLVTTANIVSGSTAISGIANTSGLEINKTYKISGAGIPADTILTYLGGGAGTLSAAATISAVASPVTIKIRIWRFRVLRVGGLGVAQFRTVIDAGDETYFSGPFSLYQGGFGSPLPFATVYANFLAAGYPTDVAIPFCIAPTPTQPRIFYNGVLIDWATQGTDADPPNAGEIIEFKTVEAEFSNVYLVNMSNTKLVRVDQLVYNEPYHAQHTGNFIPGYLPGGGTKLRAYPAGTKFQLITTTVSPGYGESLSLGVQADADPLWQEVIEPLTHSPSTQIEIARFDRNGLL